MWIEIATRPFRPRNPKVPVTWMRVKLYGYWPAGVVEFEKVSLRKVEVEGETPEEEDERTRRAWGGQGPGRNARGRDAVTRWRIDTDARFGPLTATFTPRGLARLQFGAKAARGAEPVYRRRRSSQSG